MKLNKLFVTESVILTVDFRSNVAKLYHLTYPFKANIIQILFMLSVSQKGNV